MEGSNGYLIVSPGDGGELRMEAYRAQPGDIVLYEDFNRLFHFLYRLAHTSPPTHTAIVITREDGTLALLDLTGPTVISAHVAILDIPPRLQSYPGSIMVRRVKQPLTAEQASALTQFARAQEGKEFAAKRIALQVTPFRARVGLRRTCFARTHFDRSRWICSELVVAAANAAQILDPRDYPANAIYPHDLAYDDGVDLSHRYEMALPWVADPRTVSQATPGGQSR